MSITMETIDLDKNMDIASETATSSNDTEEDVVVRDPESGNDITQEKKTKITKDTLKKNKANSLRQAIDNSENKTMMFLGMTLCVMIIIVIASVVGALAGGSNDNKDNNGLELEPEEDAVPTSSLSPTSTFAPSSSPTNTPTLSPTSSPTGNPTSGRITSSPTSAPTLEVDNRNGLVYVFSRYSARFGTHEEAAEKCGGHLASFGNPVEKALVTEIVMRKGQDEVYLGARQDGNVWEWTDGSTWFDDDGSYWAPGEPDNASPYEGATMNGDGDLNKPEHKVSNAWDANAWDALTGSGSVGQYKAVYILPDDFQDSAKYPRCGAASFDLGTLVSVSSGEYLANSCPCFNADDVTSESIWVCNLNSARSSTAHLKGGTYFSTSSDSCQYGSGNVHGWGSITRSNLSEEQHSACYAILERKCE